MATHQAAEQTRPFQDELVGIRRYAETVQNALDTVAEEQDIEVFTVGLCMVQEPLKDGVACISFLGRAHV